jgi:hypothetical protein
MTMNNQKKQQLLPSPPFELLSDEGGDGEEIIISVDDDKSLQYPSLLLLQYAKMTIIHSRFLEKCGSTLLENMSRNPISSGLVL